MSELTTFLVIVWVVILGMELTTEYTKGEEALTMIEECEKDLARDVKCIIFAKQSPIKLENKEQ